MAKERTAEKKEKKEKKSSTAEDNGVKKSKKDKKDKKSRKSDAGDVSMADADETEVADEPVIATVNTANGETKTSSEVEVNGLNKDQLLAAMVPFANPMADEKAMKKVLKSVKRGMWAT
jgi:H/ACA ribonucleoprotein complex subunit 2